MISRLLVPAAVVLAVLLLAEACGVGTSAAPGETPVERPPLDDPPDPGPVPDSDGLSDEARDRMVASTVRISGVACGVEHEGSGFAVGDDLVATNAHVLVGVEEPMIDLVDGRRLEAVIVAFDPVADLAVLRVPGAGLVPFELGTAADGTLDTLIGWEAADRPEP
ncbi:MAG: trypsin-like peptidase domain-containing protein, partial [Acidimicrobiales bacterium]